MSGKHEVVCLDTIEAASYLGISEITSKNSRGTRLLGGR